MSISSLFSQTLKDDELLKNNTYYFEISEGEAYGEGFEILKNQIKNSQFVVLGEEHFSARVSEFTNAIVPALTKNDFKYFAAEIGANSAKVMSELIKEKHSLYDFNTRINNLVGEVPVPFFDGKEDEVFLKAFMENEFELWGIDQEYFTSQVFLLDKLFLLSENSKRLNSLYTVAKDFAISATKKSIQDRKYKLSVSLLHSDEINDFFNALDRSNFEINKIIDDLKKSWEVYKAFDENEQYYNIHKRLHIMQENFTEYYRKSMEVEALPKVFVKIGGVHASKGRSHHNIYDIGNFIMELANFNQQKSTHILIFPSAHINQEGKISSNIDEADETLFSSIVDFKSEMWTLIDLKSIEKSSWKNKIESESLKDYMYRFDYMILTPASKQTELNFKK
ncbi:hypothetical protein DF185_15465 [Marinifilum breve]|uniref:Uncharacterized protein n=2 Tax=Marinifilum breve TaxID=2184082 RepID=A0A2V3ZX78_9BACT|nr:hypothetical protein DF185_15465 [Marinifilum breve]